MGRNGKFGRVIKNMKERKESLRNIFVQFIKFGMVGVSNTCISLATYYILVYFGIYYIVANTVGFCLSILNAFFWNSKYVFVNKEEKNAKKAFLKVFLSYGNSFLLSTFLIFLLVEVFHISEYLAPILRLLVTIPLNFVMNKLWAFKDRGKNG